MFLKVVECLSHAVDELTTKMEQMSHPPHLQIGLIICDKTI